MLSFDHIPKLVVDGEVFRGINILEKLHEIGDTNLFKQAATAWQLPYIPRIGFHLEAPNAIMPTKRIIDVGYDITIVEFAKQLTPMTTMYETNISLDIPLGFYVELVPRSSLSKTGYMFAHSIGIIDPSYTGTIKVALIKIDMSMPDITLPCKIAQIILKSYVVSTTYEATTKLDTKRGGGGFGSTNLGTSISIDHNAN